MTDAELDSTLRPYETSARRQPRLWGLTLCGVVFLALGMAPVRLCGELLCPGWVQSLELGLGAVILAAMLLVFTLDTRRGSRIDVDRASLVWWTGPASGERFELPLDRIARAGLAGNAIRFTDRDGGVHDMPADCVRRPHAAYPRALAAAFPHIVVD